MPNKKKNHVYVAHKNKKYEEGVDQDIYNQFVFINTEIIQEVIVFFLLGGG